MVGLVETMLKLLKDLPKVKTSHEQESIQRQIAATDKGIDALVHELYGLGENEIRIVEGGGEMMRGTAWELPRVFEAHGC
jgi:hypothetical protein